MSAQWSLRAAAMVALLLAIGHTAGHPWAPADGPASLAVLAAMRGEHFNVMGLRRSYFDFYVGFGWLLSVYLFGHTLLYWLLAPAERPHPKLRTLVLVLVIESILVLWVSWTYLFWVPLIMNVVIALLLGSALLRLQRDDPHS